ncbi:hypothetical protein GIX45_06795 [Erwinia sp. CPCC 100877]|nr:hypothetical protein [Erwinia sp. CPCC 100877]
MSDFFNIITDEIDHRYEPGIDAEINSFMEYQENDIKDFDLSFDTKQECFVLKITTNEMKSVEKKQLFKKLTLFLEFSYETFYITNQSEKSLHYTLISYSKNLKGFILDVEIF